MPKQYATRVLCMNVDDEGFIFLLQLGHLLVSLRSNVIRGNGIQVHEDLFCMRKK